MAESFVEVTEGTGTKLHSFERTIGANTVEDEVVLWGEPYLASYSVQTGSVNTDSTTKDILQLMAGASNRLRVRFIELRQVGAASSAASDLVRVLRLTTAGSGGTSITPNPFDPADAAAGATAQSAPSSNGTAGATLIPVQLSLGAAHPHGKGSYWRWDWRESGKPIIIAAGTSNGLALRSTVNVTGASLSAVIIFDESSF